MYERFQQHFRRDADVSTGAGAGAAPGGTALADAQVRDLVSRFGGTSFEKGLYRVLPGGSVEAWNATAAIAFPQLARRITCFGYDWLGRLFAVDAGRREDGAPGVVLLEPGTGEALEIPCGVVAFHDRELVDYRDEALAGSFHAKWLASGGAIPRLDQCVGYRQHLFLGGRDTVENLELSDLDVYWTLSAQLIAKTKGLPPGTPVKVS